IITPINHITHSVILTSHVYTTVFFSQRTHFHQDLHSFPTRRSSDLLQRLRLRRRGRRIVRTRGRASRGQPDGSVRAGQRRSENRSEEHTSELQSPDHLVCRLLLEKKKTSKCQTRRIHTYIQTGSDKP